MSAVSSVVDPTASSRAEIPVALRTVVVTGGASGLGAAIAAAVKRAGGTPIVFDVRPPADGIEHDIVDVSRRADVEAAIARVAQRHGEITSIVCNAGVDACGPFDAVSADAWERVIAVNLVGAASLARAALPYLERVNGKIVTVASTLGLRALSDASAYCASKFGVVGFSRALAVELAGRVGVTCLIPGGMHTAFFDGRTEQYKPGPDAKLNRPEDVAATVVFALSQPPGCEIREMIVTPSTETSWP